MIEFVLLTAKPVKCTALSFQSIDYIHGYYRLAPCVFGVGNGVLDHGFEEDFQYITRFFVYQSGYAFHSSTTG